MEILITENQFREFVNHLVEQKNLSPDEIYQKYYSKIKRDIFDKIIEADPKTIPGVKVGRYAKLLLNMFKNGNLPLEDLSKAKYYLKLVYKYNRSIPNTVQTLPEIYNIIEDKILNINSSIEDILERLDAGVDYEELKGSDNWWVFIPKTEKGAAYLGVNTEWCTSDGQYSLNPDYQDRENHFDDYNSKGNLYIIINKEDESEKYQFHFESEQFKDKNDEDLESWEPFSYDNEDEDLEKWEQFLYENDDLFYIFKKEILKNISNIPNYIIIFFNITKENIVELKLKNFEEKGFKGYLDLSSTNIKKIPEHWRVIYGNVNLYNCKLTSLGNIQTVGGSLNLYQSTSLTSLGKLETVGDNFNLYYCISLTSLGNLKKVGGYINLEDCKKIESLPENLEVKGEIYIRHSGLAKYSKEELDVMYPKLKGKWIF